MGYFTAAYTALKRVMTGEIIKQIDTPVMESNCTISLRLKRQKGSSETYVVLALVATGNYQYCAINPNEFERLASAVQEIARDLTVSSRSHS